MADIRLFQRRPDGSFSPRQDRVAALEKDLHELVAANMLTLLGIRHVRSEYATGRKHRGRIDALGLDRDGSPVIVEFKRSQNENIINQGLYYLDWLVDHRAEFENLVRSELGSDAAGEIDWSAPRLVCIAKDFSTYDQYAVQQIDRNIDLIRYRLYGEDLLLLELVAGTTASFRVVDETEGEGAEVPDDEEGGAQRGTHAHRLATAAPSLKRLYEEARDYLLSLGDDVQERELKLYASFKQLRTFASIKVMTGKGCLYLQLALDPKSVEPVPGFVEDLSSKGHHGVGDLRLILRTPEDLERAKPYILASFEGS